MPPATAMAADGNSGVRVEIITRNRRIAFTGEGSPMNAAIPEIRPEARAGTGAFMPPAATGAPPAVRCFTRPVIP